MHQDFLEAVRYRLPEDPTQPDIAMNKRIGIDELLPGMLVEKLDRSWLSTPFKRIGVVRKTSVSLA